MDEPQEKDIKRIKAHSLDNSVFIRENRLTLTGRLTNPQEQRITVLIPSLSRKWNLQGRAVGSDLGNNCFQFRFEREDDLRRVLDNRPYHFAYWMVIIQRWEPVISTSFPSFILFWIKIKGLPLHFWHDDMICRIGQELGTLDNHELTKTIARVRVLVDGLKPLVKESIVEFDSGEESPITLEYEKLEMHCSFCFSLLHARKKCPLRLEEKAHEPLTSHRGVSEGRNEHLTTRSSYVAFPDRAPSFREQSSQYLQLHADTHNQMRPSLTKEIEAHHTFQERVDRHENIFGERVSTRQT